MMKRTLAAVDGILGRWRQNDLAWLDDPPRGLNARRPAQVRALFESRGLHKSGRFMWNAGMWLDNHWSDLDATTQRTVLGSIERMMLSARHDRAFGLWKLGDTLGDHIATPATQAVLRKVVLASSSKLGVGSGLHGLAHCAYKRRRSRAAICRWLGRISRRKDRGPFRDAIRYRIRGIRRGCPCG